MKRKKHRIVLAGGGTGGHIYPAIAVGEILKNNEDAKIFYIGNPKNIEKNIVEKEGFEFLPVDIKGMPRKKDFSLIFWLFKLLFAVLKCCYYFIKIKPSVVFGTGGYVSGAPIIAAYLMKIPFVMHDSDTHPGIVSLKMGSKAKMMNVAFEDAKKYLKSKNVQVNGNPLRSSLSMKSKQEALKELGLDENKFTVFAMGGSQGAVSINSAVESSLQTLINEHNIQIIHQTGMKNYENYMQSLSKEFAGNENYLVKPYFEDMSTPLNAADLIVARSGSLSLSEFNIIGVPSVLVPFPYAAANHQHFNAKAMEENGASVYLADNLCDGENLTEIILNLMNNPQKLSEMRNANLKLAKPDAAQKIADYLLTF